MRKILFILLLMFSFSFVKEGFSQIVNVQHNLRFNLQDGTHLGVYANLENDLGNTNIFSFDASALAIFNYSNHLVLLLVDGKYSYRDSLDIMVSKSFEHLRYSYSFYDWFGIETFVQHEYDKFRRLAIRASAGAGPRFTPLAIDIIGIALGTSYMFEYSQNIKNVNYADSGQEYFLHRWNNYIHLDIAIIDWLNFYTTFYIQPSFEDFDDYLMLLDTHFEFKITEYITFNIVSKFSYDNKPPLSVDKLDYSIDIGLGFRYSFLSSSSVSSTD